MSKKPSKKKGHDPENKLAEKSSGENQTPIGTELAAQVSTSASGKNPGSNGKEQPAAPKTEPAPVVKKKKMGEGEYLEELRRLQIELVKMQEWIKFNGLKMVIIFEGRDAAGKGGAIKRITECLNPRYARVVALPAPTERERTQWYFQRYVAHLPSAGEMVLFDRSWYNRSGVERVMGFCNCRPSYSEYLRCVLSLSACWFAPASSSSNTGFRSATKSRSAVSRIASTIPQNVGSSAPWISNHAPAGSNTPAPKTTCSSIQISNRLPGSSSIPMTRNEPA